jgi:hypothetical protein
MNGTTGNGGHGSGAKAKANFSVWSRAVMLAAATVASGCGWGLVLPATGQGGEPAVTLAEALRSGPEKLAEELEDTSEAGWDRAAALYATARRLETESKLGARDLFLVQELERVREAMVQFNWDSSDAGYLMAGGGTMWSHGSVRALAWIEDALAEVAERMPDALREHADHPEMVALRKRVEALGLPPDLADVDPDAAAGWPPRKQRLVEATEQLGWALGSLRPEDAKPLLELAERSVRTLELVASGTGLEGFEVPFGPLRLGLAAEEAVAALGAPARRSEPVFEGATGNHVSRWSWPGAGVTLTLASAEEDGPWTVERMELTAPAAFRTPDGIGIGSTRAEVLEAYGASTDPENPPTEDTIVLGSLYGGVILTLEAGKVAKVFVGAAAE